MAAQVSASRPTGAAEAVRAPLCPDVGVVALVPDRWGSRWQPRHHVLSRLARYFPVVWVNPAPEFRDVLRHPGAYREPDAEPVPGMHVHSPDYRLPLLYKPAWLAKRMRSRRLRGAAERLRRAGCTRIILYVWRPEFADARHVVHHDLLCYHIDDEYSFSTNDAPISPPELDLLRHADQVFIHSAALMEKKGAINPHTALVPNGVDYDLYARAAPEPADLAAIPHPRIGYTGHVKPQMDFALLAALADRHPEWSFVLCGAIRDDPHVRAACEALRSRENVFLLGAKTWEELADYPQHCDVCIMPYRVDDYTRYIYPMKLHEYLASGRPVVGARIRTLEDFDSVVRLASGIDEWSDALTEALQAGADTAALRELRRAVARSHDWDALVTRVAARMAERIGPQVLSQVLAPATTYPHQDVEAATT